MLILLSYKPREIVLEEEVQSAKKGQHTGRYSPSQCIYTNIHDSTLNQIQEINITGSFGTKVDTLARHIMWIRVHDPGAKSVIFSQFKDFLNVLAKAFLQFNIAFAAIDQKDGVRRFKEDANVRFSWLVLGVG